MSVILNTSENGLPPYSMVTEHLAIGSCVAPGTRLPFDAVVFCAREHQPPSAAFARWSGGSMRSVPPNEAEQLIIHCPIDDTEALTKREIDLVMQTAKLCAALLMQKKRVLSSCMMGWNRSALVAGLAMHGAYGMKGNEIVERIKTKRCYQALGNDHFVAIIRKVAGR